MSNLAELILALKGQATASLESDNEPEVEEESTKKVKEKKVHLADVIEHEGPLTIPKGMTKKQAIELLQRADKEDEQVVSFTEKFAVFPWDGAHALITTIKRLSGFALREAAWSPPAEISIEIGPGLYTNVPWGIITAPGLDGKIYTGVDFEKGQMTFKFVAEVKRKHEDRVKLLASEMRKYLKEGGSIYQGKAIKMAFHDDNGESLYDSQRFQDMAPNFLNLDGVDPGRLIFTSELDSKIKDYVYTPFLYPEACEALGIPGKRGSLFQGPPGVGKTEVARVVAKLATEKGMTVVYCNAAIDFPNAVAFALMYSPAVVVCEDIDRVVGGKRTAAVDKILNIMDGLETKQQKIKFILTSNNVDDIQQPMLRPGRIDACIRFTAPDAAAVEGLIRLYAGNNLEEGADLQAAGNVLSGQIPAVIAEVVERSKLSSIRRAKGIVRDVMLNGGDLALAAKSIQEQLDLLNKQPEKQESEFVKGSKITAEATRDLAKSIQFNYSKKPEDALAAVQAATTPRSEYTSRSLSGDLTSPD